MIRLFVLLALLALPARAEVPAGHDDPRFEAALTSWLAGDNAAMFAFHELASQGNVAALIMRVRASTDTFSDEERPPPINRAWYDFATAPPLALAFRVQWEDPPYQAPEERVAALLELGEFRAGARAIWNGAIRARARNQEFPFSFDLVMRALGPELDPMDQFVTWHLIWESLDDATFTAIALSFCADASTAPVTHAALVAYCEALFENDREREKSIRAAVFAYRPQDDPFGHGLQVVRDWLVNRTDLPYDRLCQSVCAGQRSECAFAVYLQTAQAIGLVGLGSPVEALVSQDDYLVSRRADLDLWDKLQTALSLYLRDESDTGLGEAPKCLLSALED